MVGTIEILNRFYGRPDIPFGAVKVDRFSPLDGPALVKAKVKVLYVMGGRALQPHVGAA